eukprot:gb/GEZN01001238.1/.p1 GENE.gb/GEZN01001238.1/~~gb/GEZN01001238.1/.p1  ORF type:complete len:1027 (-),score=162.45 gb/GEZN01001238.1/:86-3166(-)
MSVQVGRNKSFVRRTRKGKIFNVVLEHYLRDDIWCGSKICSECDMTAGTAVLPAVLPASFSSSSSSSSSIPLYVVPDSSVVLRQIDVLEYDCPAFEHTILLQTVLNAVRDKQYKAYKRVRTLLRERRHESFVFCNEHHRSTYTARLPKESVEEHQARVVRVACRWYTQHLDKHKCRVLLLTDSETEKASAISEGLQAMTLPEYVASFIAQHPGRYNALDECLRSSQAKLLEEDKGWTYPPHLSAQELKDKLASGALQKGTFTVGRLFWLEASVQTPLFAKPVLISGLMDMNRAVDGDLVAIELLPESQWKSISQELAPGENLEVTDEDTNTSYNSGAAEAQDAVAAVKQGGEGGAAEQAGPKDLGDSRTNMTAVPSGRVVGIVNRNWKAYCGSLQLTDKSRGNTVFLPANRRIPRVRIESSQIQGLMEQRIMVQLDSWPRHSRYPWGHYTRTLGPIGDRDTETQVVLMEHEVPHAPWTPAVLACLPPQDFTITPEEYARRLDLRNTCVCSIDPPGCTDIDDALHCKELPNGNLEVGVHIADVAHFMRPETALDIEAANRCTSVYLADRRIDMIPTLLSTNLCSLHEGVERLTFSVIWELTKDCDIVSTRFAKCVIKSAGALTYQQAQDRLDMHRQNPALKEDEISKSIRQLNDLSKILKQRRLNEGALTLHSIQVKFVLNADRSIPEDVQMYKSIEVNYLVEEFMLFANITVARETLLKFPTMALLRRHPQPQPSRFEPLIAAAKSAGFEIDASTSGRLAASLDAAQKPGHGNFNKLLRVIATRCMTQAVYFCSGDFQREDFHHYGLAADVYTHFTSPIRRYADVIVHRLLETSLGLHPLPDAIKDRQRMRDISEMLNHRNRMAQLASRSSASLFTLLYFKHKGETLETGTIVAVFADGFKVLISRYGLEGTVTLVDAEETAMGKNPFRLDTKAMSLTSATHGSYKLFQRVDVKIYVKESKARRQWLVVELASKPQPSVAESNGGHPMEEDLQVEQGAAGGALKRALGGEGGSNQTKKKLKTGPTG